MKLIVLLMTVAILQISAATRAQNITMKKDNASLEQVIKEIRQQSGYDFFYNLKLIQKAMPVSVNIKNMPLEEALKKVFENQPLTYTVTIADKAVVVKEKQGSSVLEKVNNLLFIPVRVTGRVTDTTGTPLTGATVKIKGQSNSILTDDKGAFTFSAESGADVIVSFVGFKAYTFKVIENLPFQNIVLQTLASKLDQINVVSTGYQDIPKERATGSFTKIDNKLYNRSVSANILTRLLGVTNGLQSISESPGENVFRIRGNSTIYANAEPLVILDNFPYEGNINNINPNDIETVTILKDAAAASIWGVRASNGVIVLVSKKGKLNQPLKVSVNANVSLSGKPDLSYGRRISSSDYIELEKYLFNQGFFDDKISDTYSFSAITPVVKLLNKVRNNELSAELANQQIEAFKNNDVRDDLSKYWFQKAVSQQYSVGINGGDSHNRYYISTGWDKSLGSLVGNQNSRVTLDASNIYTTRNNKWTFSSNIIFSNTKTWDNSSLPDPLPLLYPYASLADENGKALLMDKYNSNYIDTAGHGKLLDWHYYPKNELSLNNSTNEISDYRVNLGLNYKINEWLSADVKYQYGNGTTKAKNNHSPNSYYVRDLINTYSKIDPITNEVVRAIPFGGILDQNNSSYESSFGRAAMNFNFSNKVDHEFSGIIGAEIRNISTEGFTNRLYGYDEIHATSIPVDYVNLYPTFITGAFQNIANNDKLTYLSDRYVSLFSNVAYTYRGKYTISASARKDGSNLFGVNSNQKWNPLWSSGISWNISKEDFFHSNLIDFLKTRITYGFSGNVDKTASAYLTTVISGTNFFGQPNSFVNNPPNPNLQWEKTGQFNIGLDFGFFRSRIVSNLDFYFKKSSGLMGYAQLPTSSGLNQFYGNTADMKGHGVDLMINTINLRGKFAWNSIINFNYANDRVTDYKVDVKSNRDLILGSLGASPIIGKPLYSVYSFKWAGLDPQTGDPQGYLNGQVSKDYSAMLSEKNENDLIYSGPRYAPYYGNFLNEFSYSKFSISFNLVYKFGNVFRRNSVDYGNAIYSSQLPYIDYQERWQKPGDESKTNVPSLTYPPDPNRDYFYQRSDALIENAAFVRLQDVQLSYGIDEPKKVFKSLKFYIVATNLGLIWKANHHGIDPENIPGTGGYKVPKTISIGLKSDF